MFISNSTVQISDATKYIQKCYFPSQKKIKRSGKEEGRRKGDWLRERMSTSDDDEFS